MTRFFFLATLSLISIHAPNWAADQESNLELPLKEYFEGCIGDYYYHQYNEPKTFFHFGNIVATLLDKDPTTEEIKIRLQKILRKYDIPLETIQDAHGDTLLSSALVIMNPKLVQALLELANDKLAFCNQKNLYGKTAYYLFPYSEARLATLDLWRRYRNDLVNEPESSPSHHFYDDKDKIEKLLKPFMVEQNL